MKKNSRSANNQGWWLSRWHPIPQKRGGLLWNLWKEWNGETTIIRYDQAIGARIFFCHLFNSTWSCRRRHSDETLSWCSISSAGCP